MENQILVQPYVSWIEMNSTVFIVDERFETIVTLEDYGVLLWNLIIKENSRGSILKTMVRPSFESEDIDAVSEALDTLISLGLIREECHENL